MTKVILGHHVTWHLRHLMKKHGFTSARALHRRLRELDNRAVGVSQFSRIIDSPSERLSLRTLVGLVAVFGCEVSDLIEVTRVPSTGEDADTPSTI